MVVVLVQAHLDTPAVVGAGPPAAALWQRLRRACPWVVAAVLLPRGVQWLGRAPSVDVAQRTMLSVWSPLRRRLGWPQLHLDLREVSATRVGVLARRLHGVDPRDDTVPPQAPLPGWSTARDLLGGVVDPWVRRRVYRDLTWGAGGCWHPHSLQQAPPGEPHALLDAARAALRAPWLDATAPTVAGLLGGMRARLSGVGRSTVPSAWVDAALRCALDPRLRAFSQPCRPSGRPAEAGTTGPLRPVLVPGPR